MRCPYCPCEQPPVESGPYSTIHVGEIVYLVCPECSSIIDAVPVPVKAPELKAIVFPIVVEVREQRRAA